MNSRPSAILPLWDPEGPHRGPEGKGRGERGFTLVELAVVAVLIVLLAAVAAPSFAGFWRASQERNCAWQLAALARTARDYAIVHAVRAAIEYDPEAREFRLAAQSDDPNAGDELQPLALAGAQPVRVPEAVEQVAVSVEGQEANSDATLRSSGAASLRSTSWPVVFFPDGQALAARIAMQGSQGAWTVSVAPLTGQAKVIEGDAQQSAQNAQPQR